MILQYIIFALDNAAFVFSNAVLIQHVSKLNGPYIFLGITGSSTALVSFLWKPIAGRLSDQKGSNVLLFWCLLGGLIGTIISALSGSLYTLYFGRLLTALATPTQVLIRTSITNLDKENQAKHISRLGITGGVVCVISGLLCGNLLELPDGVSYIYTIMTINSIISVILSKCLPIIEPEASDQIITSSPTQRAFAELKGALHNLKNISTSDTYWDIFCLKAFISLSFSAIDSNGVIIFNSIGISHKNIAYMYVCIRGTLILSNVFLLKVNKKYYTNDIGYRRILHAGYALITFCLLLAFSSNLFMFIILFLLMISARVQAENTMMELLLHKIGNGDKAIVLGCFDSLLSLTDLISPIISSIALEVAGIPSVFILSSICVITSSIVIVIVKYTPTSDLKKE